MGDGYKKFQNEIDSQIIRFRDFEKREDDENKKKYFKGIIAGLQSSSDIAKAFLIDYDDIKEHPKEKAKLMLLNKEDLVKIIHAKSSSIAKTVERNSKLKAQLRANMRRMIKVRNEIDYHILHPYSLDSSMQTKKHDRDSRKGTITQEIDIEDSLDEVEKREAIGKFGGKEDS